MRPRAAIAVLALACLAASAAADPLAAFRPPRGASDRAASLGSAPQRSADEARAGLGSTKPEAAFGASSEEEASAVTTYVEPTNSEGVALDASLSSDVSAAVAFARSSLDAYENDRRYAQVVHEAVDALENQLLEDSHSALSPERVARDATLRVALVEYIRPEKKFDGISQLREQIGLDSHDARVLLESIGPDDLRRAPE